jgi:YVTN family beta-propeller protein
MSMRTLLIMGLLLSGGVEAAGTDAYTLQTQYSLSGAGGWDYLSVDAPRNHLFIAHATQVLVINTQDGSLAGAIADTQGVHGVALAPDLGKGFTSNGRSDTVTVFDLQTLKPTGSFAVGGHNPDAILYDAASRHLYTFNGRSQDISVIDPATGSLVATLPAGGKPEFAASDGKGRIYFNVETTAEIGVIDSLTSKRIATWPLPGCEEPTGLAFDVVHQRLFSTCDNGVLAVTNARNGKQVATIPIGKGPDAAAFDAERGLVFTSNGTDGTLSVIHEVDQDHFVVIATVATQKGARTLALDEKTHRIYLVTAEFEAAPAPTADQPHPRPAVKDGTFKLLVIGTP